MTKSQSNGNRRSVRREFLKTAGAAFASVGVGSSVATGADGTSDRHLRVGIAGGGNFGNSFAHFRDHPDCQVVAGGPRMRIRHYDPL